MSRHSATPNPVPIDEVSAVSSELSDIKERNLQASPKPKPKRARSAQPKSTKAGSVKPEAAKAVKKTAEVTGAKRGREPGQGKGVEKNATKAGPGKPTPGEDSRFQKPS